MSYIILSSVVTSRKNTRNFCSQTILGFFVPLIKENTLMNFLYTMHSRNFVTVLS